MGQLPDTSNPHAFSRIKDFPSNPGLSGPSETQLHTNRVKFCSNALFWKSLDIILTGKIEYLDQHLS